MTWLSLAPSLIALLIKAANWLIDRHMQKSEDAAATMAVLNQHMKGALNEIHKADVARDAADAAVAADPDSLRNIPSALNADNPPGRPGH